jgi:hypothetical protein
MVMTSPLSNMSRSKVVMRATPRSSFVALCLGLAKAGLVNLMIN